MTLTMRPAVTCLYDARSVETYLPIPSAFFKGCYLRADAANAEASENGFGVVNAQV
jgi:hypothetical protein